MKRQEMTDSMCVCARVCVERKTDGNWVEAAAHKERSGTRLAHLAVLHTLHANLVFQRLVHLLGHDHV